MQYLGTITSKRQLTIPAMVFHQLGWKHGQKVIIRPQKDGVKVEPAVKLVNRLAGSIQIPRRFQGLSVDQMVTKARQEYFRQRPTP